MTPFTCVCGNTLFFENTRCLQCQRAVGYAAELSRMVPIDPGGDWVLCRNGLDHGVCNWVVPASKAGFRCRSCQFTRIVADLTVAENLQAWHKIEMAKRRVFQTLTRLGLHPSTKAESPDGLAFDFLASTPEMPVLTGHAGGVITLNIHEADDAYRENERKHLGEPYRTLIGHFRHETGHYYWDQFFKGKPDNDPALQQFRELFGDEREDYAASLARHYERASTTNPAEHITNYAGVHPWEDWAETWAQYLHFTDGIETARSYGWQSSAVLLPFTPLKPEVVFGEAGASDRAFLDEVNEWAKFTPALNEIAASLGQPNLYPFVFAPVTVRKMAFVHAMARKHSESRAARAA